MSMTREATTVDAWLQWCATEKQAACRAHLCIRYYLNALDAEPLIHAAAWLKTTPEAVRVARQGACRALRAPFHSSSRRYHLQPCRKCAFLRQNSKIGSWKDNDLQASACLFSVICDRTFMVLGSTTTQENRMYKATRLYSPRVVYSQSLGLDETLRAKEIVQ